MKKRKKETTLSDEAEGRVKQIELRRRSVR
jgi:hypothetical protein